MNLAGVHSVLYALFDRHGHLDRDAMRAQVKLMLAQGIDGITVLGLATEGPKLNPDEQCDVIRWAAEDVAGIVPYSATISGNSVTAQRKMIQYCLDHNVDWLILQPPSTGSYAGDVYLDYFLEVADGFDAVFSIQNAPQYLGRGLTSQDIGKLTSQNPNFSVIKAESSAVDFAHLIANCGNKLQVLNGRGGLELTDCLRAGAQGFILAPDAIDFTKKAYDHWVAGEFEKAEKVYAHALPAIVFMMQSLEHLICYGKRIFGLRAGIEIYDRSPSLLPTEFGLRSAQYWADYLGKYE
ncbi:MAG: dihydrodipicolinate synthase family protein [Rhizobiales bacterium]|nr:dihydrodipicolinate synthase family protein [Hyphomicrobiales bacterium]